MQVGATIGNIAGLRGTVGLSNHETVLRGRIVSTWWHGGQLHGELAFKCPLCGRRHRHGWRMAGGPQAATPRQAHCGTGGTNLVSVESDPGVHRVAPGRPHHTEADATEHCLCADCGERRRRLRQVRPLETVA